MRTAGVVFAGSPSVSTPEPEPERLRHQAAWEFATGDAAGVVKPGAREGIRDVPAAGVPRAESLPPELRVPTASPSERIYELPRPVAGAATPKPPISEAPTAP